MKQLSVSNDFKQTIELLRAHSFAVEPSTGIAGGVLVSKHGVGAILVPAQDGAAAFAMHPGVLVHGEVGRLLDRGYQKFIKTSQYELPASAAYLQAIHRFSEELSQLTGGISLYNQSLGTTSDRYQYDRLQGREIEGREIESREIEGREIEGREAEVAVGVQPGKPGKPAGDH